MTNKINVPNVFISHASEDKERFVLDFAHRLRKNGINAWLDVWEMMPGDSLVHRVFEEGIKNAQAMIIVLSKNSVEKPWVREELNRGFINRLSGHCKIIPVVLDNCAVPEALVSTVWQTIPDLENYDAEFKRILDALYGRTDKPPLGTPAMYGSSSPTPEASAIIIQEKHVPKKLGSNFLLSVVPPLVFMIISILVFDPILGITFVLRQPENVYQLIIFGVAISIFTVIIGFNLNTLSDFTLKVFEGYITPFPFAFLYKVSHRIHFMKAQSLIEQRDRLRSKIQRLEKQIKNRPKLEVELRRLKDQYYESAAHYSILYPEDLGKILPTRFGNILKAAEDYSAERYGFDSVSFWPRLIQVIPDNYKVTIDNARNNLLFHVNMSILSFIFAWLGILAVFYLMSTVSVEAGNSLVFAMFLANALRYLVAAFFGYIVGGFFYSTSIMSAKSFSLVMRTIVDLFRMELLKKYGIETPKDSVEEFERWNNLNELIVLGSHSLTFKKIDYRHEK